MKLGEAGEAFFVFETEHEVPEEFQTSPIVEAVQESKADEVMPIERITFLIHVSRINYDSFIRNLHFWISAMLKIKIKVKKWIWIL